MIGQELKVRGRPFFFLTCNVRKTGSVVSRSKHNPDILDETLPSPGKKDIGKLKAWLCFFRPSFQQEECGEG